MIYKIETIKTSSAINTKKHVTTQGTRTTVWTEDLPLTTKP